MSYFLIYKLSLAFYLLMITVNQYNSTQGPEQIHGTVFTRLDPFSTSFFAPNGNLYTTILRINITRTEQV